MLDLLQYILGGGFWRYAGFVVLLMMIGIFINHAIMHFKPVQINKVNNNFKTKELDK